MLDVQAALTAAQVPGYRGAFRPTDGCREPPGCYCAYTLSRAPIWPSDDASRAMRIRAFLHLFSRDDPLDAQAAIFAAMNAQGWHMIRETEGYVGTAEDYEVFSEWEGVE